MKILLASQDDQLVTQLKTDLRALGHSPLHLSTAVSAKLPNEPLLVIIDAAEAQKLDFSTANLRKKQQPLRKILLSASPLTTDNETTTTPEADDFLTLPYDLAELKRRIDFNLQLLRKQPLSEQRYRDLFDNMRSGVAVYEAIDNGNDFIFNDFNAAAEKAEKVKCADIIGKPVSQIFPGVIEFGLLEVLQRVWKTGHPARHPISIYADNRLQGWRENYVYRLPSGEVVAIYDDVTEQKKSEINLQESKERLSFALHGANSGIWDWNIPENILYFDENYYTIAGYEPYEFPCTYDEWHKRVHPDDLESAVQEITQTVEGATEGFATKFRFKTKDGNWKWILGQGKSIAYDTHGSPIRVTGMHTDIDKSKTSELALRASESRIASILRAAPTGIGMVINRVLHSPNQKMCDITGYSAKELIGQSARMLYPTKEEFKYVGAEKYRQIRLNGTGTVETHWVCKDGKSIDVLLSSTPINAEDLSEGVTFTALDITARKKAERALRESEKNLRTILTSIGDAVIATDFQQRIININPIAEQLTGWTEEEAIGKDLKDIFLISDAETGEAVNNIVNKSLAANKTNKFLSHSILKTRDNNRCHIACSFAPLKDSEENTKGVVLVFRDITEDLQTQEELQRMQTLESIGILAGGIAHDFNNILMGLFGNITMAKRKLADDHPSYSNLIKAESSADRAKNLTGKLLTFAKGGEPIRDHVSLAELVKEVAQFDLSGSNVKLTFDRPTDLWAADVDKGQIQQVFSNLATNANQAMPEGGKLHISLQNLDNTDLHIKSLEPGKYIKASVTDSGDGISNENLKKIFEPYFSTKQTGSGLGLATVYSIINKHKGQIDVTSAHGEGTNFTLFLPATDSQPPTQTVQAEQPEKKSSANARVLIMDDEIIILELATEMLKSFGHSVTTVENSGEAIQHYKQASLQKESFDLVILDLTIPGGPGGLQTVKEILAINPDAKVLVASGYAEDPVMSRCEDYGFKGVISKPYSIEELQKALETTLAV